MPPSPRFPARMSTATYLRLTISTSDHRNSDAMPSTFSGVGATPRPP